VQPVVDLSGAWRARTADDDLRRDGLSDSYDDSAWPTINVPGHWRDQPGFVDSDGPLLYRRSLHAAPPDDGQRSWVCFDGLFYQGDVWLDGAYLGDPEGYFAPHNFDVTALARLSADHVLAVEVNCSPQRNKRQKRAITGVFQHWDCLDDTRNPGGIWRGVRWETTGSVRIDRLRVLCRDANETRAYLRIHAQLDSDQARRVRVRTTVGGVVLAEQEQSLASGANEVDWNLDVPDPDLWWPWSLGPQPLTDVCVEVIVDGVISHTASRRTGLREVSMQDWRVSVNGETLFLKGANIGPTRTNLAAATADEIRHDVTLAREAGLDLLRVHGHIGRPELYEAADEVGMLLWQDFPLQWSYARTIRREAVRQAREAVDLLGHHPSIAVWCAHNDPVSGPSGQVIRGNTAQHIVGQQLPSWNKSILDGWVKRAIEAADDTRAVIAHSGIAPHFPQLDGTDSHLYLGWTHGEIGDMSGLAANVPRMVRFVSEFGAQAIPDHADFLHPQRWPHLDWHEAEVRYGMQVDAFERHVPPNRFANFAAWREASQQYQATLLQRQIETLRRLKYRPTGGFCFFLFADSEPRVSWSVLDHQRSPKLAYQAVTDACRPVIVVADQLADRVRPGTPLALDVHVVSDVRHHLEAAHCRAALRWPGGVHEWAWQGDVPPDDCVRIGTIQFVVPDVRGELWLDLTLEYGQQIVTNRYAAKVSG
jgi:beta-mannosidase